MNSFIYRNFKYFSTISRTRNATQTQVMVRFYASSSSPPEALKSKSITVYDKFDNLTHLYKFPHMGYASFVSNLKIYLLPMLTFTTLFITLSSEDGNIDYEAVQAICLMHVLCIGQAALFSIPVRNFVGHIYVNPELEVVLSYLNGYGNRADEKFPAGDLTVRSRETGLLPFITKDSFYVFLVSKSTGRKFRLNLKHGELFDEDLFRELFGEIPENACH